MRPRWQAPAHAHGFQDASADLGVIDSWWRRQPDANIGVPTGAAGGIDVVDVDVHETGSGFAAFEHARRAGFVEGWAWMVRTPSGGLHAYFLRTSAPAALVASTWQAHRLPRRWRLHHRAALPRSPARTASAAATSRSRSRRTTPGPVDAAGLRGFLDPPRPMRPPPDLPAIGARPDKLAAWVASRPEGGRNGGLFWAACRMAEEGHDLSTTTSLLGEAAYTAGLPEREAMATIRSAYRIARRLGSVTEPRPTNAVEAVGL